MFPARKTCGVCFFLFLKDDDDVDYLPPEKRQKSSESNKASSIGSRTAEEFTFGKMKIKYDFIYLYFFMKRFWIILCCKNI